MQSRNSNAQSRLVILVSLVIILIVGVLYFMKRVEANRLSAELSSTRDEKREQNGKITDYIQKMEEMTRQLGDLQSKLARCEDSKNSLAGELSKAKVAVTQCQDQQSQHVLQKGAIEDELDNLKHEQQRLNEQLQSDKQNIQQLQQTVKENELELDSCHTTSTQCQNSLNGLQAQQVQLRSQLTLCQQQSQQQHQQPQMGQQSLPALQQRLPNNPNLPPSAYQPKPVGNVQSQFNHAQFQNRAPNVPSNPQQNPKQADTDGHPELSYPEELDDDEENEPLSDKENEPLSEKEEGFFVKDKEGKEGDQKHEDQQKFVVFEDKKEADKEEGNGLGESIKDDEDIV